MPLHPGLGDQASESTLQDAASERTLQLVQEAVEEINSVFVTELIAVPGVGAAVAYAAADAFGTKVEIVLPKEGTISNVLFLDHDDEGLQKELILFDEDFTGTADNSAFAVTDLDLKNCVGIIVVDTFYDFANNRLGVATPALSYKAPKGKLWGQWITRGADNIAASNIPEFKIVVVQ